MLKLLVKKQLTEIFRAYLYDAKKNRARSKAATIGYIVFFVLLMAGVIGGMFTTLSLTMCRSMAEAGMSWFYFAIMGLMAILLGAFGSVFTTYSSLYLPKDNDQMLSLPIPVDTLIAARLLGVYLMGLMYSGVVVLPAIIVYWATVSAAPLHLLAGVLFLLLISLFVMAISCLLGWVVAKVSLKLKNKSFVTVVLSLVFFGLYYYFFSFKATSLLTELLQNIALYGDKVRSSAYPVYLFGQAGAGDPLSMLLLTVAIAVLFGLTWLLLSRSFLSIATASGHVGRKVYRAKAVRCRSISSALLMALLGLFLGLKMPNLSWTNEVVPIKQSACVALSLFSGWAVAMIPGALYLLTGIGSLDPLLYLSVVTALVLILSAVLSLWVKKTGSCIFAAL